MNELTSMHILACGCVSLSVCLCLYPGVVGEVQSLLMMQDWYFAIEPHTLRCPTVYVKRGLVVFRCRNVMHNVIMASTELELETRLLPLLGSLLKTPRWDCLFTAWRCVYCFLFPPHFPCCQSALEGEPGAQ